MNEQENLSVEDENPDAVAQAAESSEHNDVSQDSQRAEQQKRNDAEYNWAEMRRQMREKDQQIEELSRSHKNRSQEEEDDLAKLAEDDILTVAQARKLAQKMARNVAEDVFRQREASTVGERISLKYPDYADIVTKENIELAEQLEPELAEAIGKMDDPYKQRVTAYKLLKRVAHKGEVGNSMEKKKAMANSQKPLSVNAVTKQSAIGNAHLFENGLTAELKKQLWKEMRDAAKAS
jgi:hypothetical protein